MILANYHHFQEDFVCLVIVYMTSLFNYSSSISSFFFDPCFSFHLKFFITFFNKNYILLGYEFFLADDFFFLDFLWRSSNIFKPVFTKKKKKKKKFIVWDSLNISHIKSGNKRMPQSKYLGVLSGALFWKILLINRFRLFKKD